MGDSSWEWRAALDSRLVSTCTTRRRSAVTRGSRAGRSMTRLLRPPPTWNRLLASSTSTVTSTGSGDTGRVPVSMRATSSRSPIRWRMLSDWSRMIRRNWVISAGSRSGAFSSRVSVEPLMAARGVRSSWLTMPRNSARSRSRSSSGVMSWMEMTTDSTSPSSERMGVALTRAVMLRPSGARSTISSACTVSPVISPWDRGNSSRETSRPSARRKVSTSSKLLRRPVRLAQAADDPPGLPVDGADAAGAGVQDQHAHRRGVHQGFQVGPSPLLVAVPAGVGDDQRRLGGEHHQGLLVLCGELDLLLAQVDASDALPPVTQRRRQEGKGRAHRHRRLELGQAQLPGRSRGSPAAAAARRCC